MIDCQCRGCPGVPCMQCSPLGMRCVPLVGERELTAWYLAYPGQTAHRAGRKRPGHHPLAHRPRTTKPDDSRKIASLLACLQDAAVRRSPNAYQIAKATVLPLRSIQKLLSQTANPTLRNVEVILEAFGMSIYITPDGQLSIKPGRRRSQRHPPGRLRPAPPSDT